MPQFNLFETVTDHGLKDEPSRAGIKGKSKKKNLSNYLISLCYRSLRTMFF